MVTPDGWQEFRLGDLCEIYQPQTISGKDLSPLGRYVVYGANGPIGRYDRYNHELSEVTVTCRGATCGTVNLTPPRVWITGNAMVVRPDPHLLSKAMLRYLLDVLDYTEVITGAAQPQITRATLAPSLIRVPPVEEQEVISEALSDADAAIEALDALIAKKRDVKQAAMQQLLIGRTRLPGFEGKWEEELVGSLFTLHRTTALSRAQLSDAGEIGYIHYGDIHSRWVSHLDLSRHSLPRVDSDLAGTAAAVVDGDLVLADASEDLDGVGKAVEVMGIGSRRVIAGLHTVLLRPRAGVFAPGFVGYVPSTPAFKLQARTLAAGLKVYGLSKTSLRQIAIRVPHTQEQAAIAQVLMDMDAEVEALVAERDKMRLVKQGMMQELLSGRVRLV